MKNQIYKNLFYFCFAFFTFVMISPSADASGDVTIHLQVETATSTLLNQNLTVTECEDSPGSGVMTVNGYCAIDQSGLLDDWSWWGTDAFLNSLGGYENNAGGNGIYWNYFSDLEYGAVSLNKHALVEGENLLLMYDKNPLKIEVATTTPNIGDLLSISVKQFGFDSGWNPVWSDATSSTLEINGVDYSIDTGIYSLSISTTSPYVLVGKKSGYLNSQSVTINGQTVEQSTASPVVDGGSPDINITPVVENKNFDLEKAIEFLSSKQKTDGSYSSDLYTDWVAIAYGAYGQNIEAKNKILEYLKNNQITLLNTTDYERHAMTLMSLGLDPYTSSNGNLIKKIISSYDGKQVGDQSLYNDDIFALFPLLKSGYSADDPMIINIVDNIVSGQSQNGSWGSIDMTSASIQALTPFKNRDNVATALESAKNFLKANQKNDGGFSNSFSTSWTVMAINSLGESIDNWKQNNNTPLTFLTNEQATDGGIKNEASEDNRIWATAYAIPAIMNKNWYSILTSFQKPTSEEININEEKKFEQIIDNATSTIVATSTQVEEKKEELDIIIKNEEEKNKIDIENATTSKTSIEKTNRIENQQIKKVAKINKQKIKKIITKNTVKTKQDFIETPKNQPVTENETPKKVDVITNWFKNIFSFWKKSFLELFRIN